MEAGDYAAAVCRQDIIYDNRMLQSVHSIVEKGETIVIYSSQTGNTRKLATQIFAAIPGDSKDLKNIDEYREKDAELYFVGFWVDRGDCDEKTVELLSGLHGKKIALFGTCGMGNDPAYYQKVIDRVKTWIPEDNEYMDAFLCQGKMPIQVRRRYEEMAKSGQNTEQIQAMIRNFDRAMLHPDRADEAAAADFAIQVWKRIGS